MVVGLSLYRVKQKCTSNIVPAQGQKTDTIDRYTQGLCVTLESNKRRCYTVTIDRYTGQTKEDKNVIYDMSILLQKNR